MNVLVSVIVPVFNCERFLPTLITSLKNQKFKDFEVVFINDGSTDDSLIILERLLSNCNFRKSVFSQQNKGVSSARNLGIQKSEGAYLSFIDADDYVTEDFLQKLIDRLEGTEADLVYCGFNKVNEKKEVVSDYEKDLQFNYINDVLSTEVFITNSCRYNTFFHLCSAIYKKDIIKKNHLEFVYGAIYGEDREFIEKYLLNTNTIASIHSAEYLYLINNDSITGSRLIEIQKARVEVLKRILSFVIKSKPELLNYYREEYFPREILNSSIILLKRKEFKLFVQIMEIRFIKDIFFNKKIPFSFTVFSLKIKTVKILYNIIKRFQKK